MKGQATPRPVVVVPDYIRSATEAHFFRESVHEWRESVAYWAGFKSATEWAVTTLIVPAARTTWGSFVISGAVNAEVVSVLSMNKLRLIAQIHTHPGDWVGHSDGDDLGAALAHENFLSIVVPAYGVGGMREMKECGVHRFELGAFRQIMNDELVAALRWVPAVKTC